MDAQDSRNKKPVFPHMTWHKLRTQGKVLILVPLQKKTKQNKQKQNITHHTIKAINN